MDLEELKNILAKGSDKPLTFFFLVGHPSDPTLKQRSKPIIYGFVGPFMGL
jgi:hypothetical protein